MYGGKPDTAGESGTGQDRAPFAGLNRIRFQGSCLNRRCHQRDTPGGDLRLYQASGYGLPARCYHARRQPGARSLTPELLLFDLGGVLVEFAGPTELGQHLRWPSTPDAILKRWIECPHTSEFERGALTPLVWAERFIADWDVDLRPDEFLRRFTTWSRRLLPGATELLEELRPHYRLAALSNSNELHWERNTNELRLIELFEFAISSHQVGLCKPNPDIFKLR